MSSLDLDMCTLLASNGLMCIIATCGNNNGVYESRYKTKTKNPVRKYKHRGQTKV